MENPQKHLELLGLKVRDRVTGFKGVITSICFDLYGCIQAAVNPGTKDGQIKESHWFDLNRLKIESTTPVMAQPDFAMGPQAEARQGAAPKPSPKI